MRIFICVLCPTWCMGIFMAKDSQIDPKEVREQKAKGGPTSAQSANDGEGRNHKKQSASRHKPGNDR